MPRKYIDCRVHTSVMNYTISLFADSDDELLEAAVQHAVSVHEHKDSPDLRQQLRQAFNVERRHAP